MQSKAVGSYTATQVDRAVSGQDWNPSYRVRAEVLNRYLEKIRDLTGLILGGSRVYHDSTTDIRGACELNIREIVLTLTDYSLLTISTTPLFYLHFDEASGNFNDSSGNSRTFTTNGTITYAQPSLLPNYVNNGIKPNGTTGYASKADASWMNVTNITLALWWKGTGTNQALIDRDDNATRFWRLEVDSNGDLTFLMNFTTGSNPTTFTATVAPINDGNPHFICAIYDGAHVTLEVDGVIISRTAETRTMKTTGTMAINIARTNAASHFSSGTFDEAAMWGRALTAAERRNLYQSGIGDTKEIDYTRDLIKVYMAVAMVADPDVTVDADWAEYALIVAVPTSPTRTLGEIDLVRHVIGQDLSVLLKNAKFTNRWTVAGSVNYITGSFGVLAITTQAGLDNSGWSVTTTSSVLPSTFDWPIGTVYLDAINYLLRSAGYKPLRFNGNGQAVIAPIVLPQNRTIEDTLSTDSTSQIAAEMEEDSDLSQAFNVVAYYRSNPDNTTQLVSVQRNTNWLSDTCIQKIGENAAPPVQLDAADQNSLDLNAQNVLAQYITVPKRIKMRTLGRPFHDDEDCLQLNLTGTTPTLNFSGKVLVESWNLPLDIGTSDNVLMEFVCREVVSIS